MAELDIIKCIGIGGQTSGKKATFKDGRENEVEAPNCTIFLRTAS